MSYGYTPRFSNRGLADLQGLALWLQEEVLDELDRLLDSVPVPDVAQRLDPHPSIHDLSRVAAGVEHVVFITTVLDVGGRQMRVTQIGHHVRPNPE